MGRKGLDERENFQPRSVFTLEAPLDIAIEDGYHEIL